MEKVTEEKIDKLEVWKERASNFEGKIEGFIENGVGWEPDADHVLYCQTVVPNLSEEDLKGTDPLVLETMFEGDVEGDISERKLFLIKMGAGCSESKKEFYQPGDQITVRGHAYKLNLKEGVFFTVRDYDLIGKHV
tara:strand:- start:253 stop:660 length:408 start_codon:yes stop_codon:yes gene_type:complete